MGKAYARVGQVVTAYSVGWNNNDIMTDRFVGTQRIVLPYPVEAKAEGRQFVPVFYGV